MRRKDLEHLRFCEKLAAYIDAGVPLVKALELLSELHKHPLLLFLVKEIGSADKSVENPLTQALEKHGRTFFFPPLLRQLIFAGECGGILDTALNRYVKFLRRKMRIDDLFAKKAKGVLSSLLYQGRYIIPTGPRVVVAAGRFAERALCRLTFQPTTLGELTCLRFMFEFNCCMNILLSLGVPVLDALECIASSLRVKDRRMAHMLRYTRDAMGLDNTLAGGMSDFLHEKAKAFGLNRGFLDQDKPLAAMIQMIAVGENTSAMDTMQGKMGESYYQELVSLLN